jgi:hypothetical protein
MKPHFSLTLIPGMLALGAGTCLASPITTYQITDATIPAGPFGIDGATVSGTIETDGTIGALVTGNILAWNVLVTNGIGGSFDLTSGNSVVTATGTALTATATELLFNFDTPNDGGLGYFQIVDSSNGWGWWLSGPNGSSTEGVLSDTSASCCDAGLASLNSQPITLATTTPEPASFVLLGAGLGVIGLFRRSRRVRQHP